MVDLNQLAEAIVDGNAPRAKQLVEEALAEGAQPEALLNDCLIPAMDKVGRLFECNEYFVPEMLIAARAMNGCLTVLRPRMAASGIKAQAKVVIGTVKGDLHDIGKNLVGSMLEGAGFEVIDLGVDVSPEQFLTVIREQKPELMAMSALLTTTMPSMESTLKALEEAGVRGDIKVMVGGAPVTQDYANRIGADGYSTNANGAVALARQLAPAAHA